MQDCFAPKIGKFALHASAASIIVAFEHSRFNLVLTASFSDFELQSNDIHEHHWDEIVRNFKTTVSSG